MRDLPNRQRQQGEQLVGKKIRENEADGERDGRPDQAHPQLAQMLNDRLSANLRRVPSASTGGRRSRDLAGRFAGYISSGVDEPVALGFRGRRRRLDRLVLGFHQVGVAGLKGIHLAQRSPRFLSHLGQLAHDGICRNRSSRSTLPTVCRTSGNRSGPTTISATASSRTISNMFKWLSLEELRRRLPSLSRIQ